jgi:ATP-dependent Zn protease
LESTSVSQICRNDDSADSMPSKLNRDPLKFLKALVGTKFKEQYEEVENDYNQHKQTYQIHPNTITHSQPINTKQIAKLFQKFQSQALEQEIKKIEREINQPLTEELKRLVSDFIQTRKKMIKDENDKALELENQLLDEKGFPEEDIEKIIDYCKRLTIEQEQLQANIEIPTN